MASRRKSRPMPGVWSGLAWALQEGNPGGGISRSGLFWRTVTATSVSYTHLTLPTILRV